MYRAALLIALTALPAHAQDAKVASIAKSTLSDLQERSFDADREYCGMIGRNVEGQLVVSRPRRGRVASCRPRDLPDGYEVVASYHTHGSYDPAYDNEVPSSNDVYSDMDEGVNGYISTPGGRFWFVDGQTGEARQLCGLGCLPQDPEFQRDLTLPVPQSFTLQELLTRERE